MICSYIWCGRNCGASVSPDGLRILVMYSRVMAYEVWGLRSAAIPIHSPSPLCIHIVSKKVTWPPLFGHKNYVRCILFIKALNGLPLFFFVIEVALLLRIPFTCNSSHILQGNCSTVAALSENTVVLTSMPCLRRWEFRIFCSFFIVMTTAISSKWTRALWIITIIMFPV